jgi:hypothetical protein
MRPTVFDTIAVIGGIPRANSMGKVTSVPAPAPTLMTPATGREQNNCTFEEGY